MEKKAYRFIAPNSREEERGFTRHLHLPSPRLLQALPASGRAPPQPLSPLCLSLWGNRGRSQLAEKPPGKLGHSPVQRRAGRYLPSRLWRRKTKSLSQSKGDLFQGSWRGSQGARLPASPPKEPEPHRESHLVTQRSLSLRGHRPRLFRGAKCRVQQAGCLRTCWHWWEGCPWCPGGALEAPGQMQPLPLRAWLLWAPI